MNPLDGRAIRLTAQFLIFIFTGVVILLLQPVFVSNAIFGWMTAIAIGVAVISYFRPHNGLLILAALVPLGPTLGTVLGVRMRESEALVLAFLAGVLLRGWALHQFRDVQLTKLHASAVLFAGVVALSCLAQLRGAEARELGEYLTRYYLTSSRGFGMIVSAMLLVEGVALLLYAAHRCRTQPWLAHKLMRLLVIGGVAAAAINLWFFVNELRRNRRATGMADRVLCEPPMERARRRRERGRLVLRDDDVHGARCRHGDSQIAMGMGRRWTRVGRRAMAHLVAHGHHGCLDCHGVLAREDGCSNGRCRDGGLASSYWPLSVPIGAFAAQYFLVRPRTPPPLRLVNIRWMFLETTARMLADAPCLRRGHRAIRSLVDPLLIAGAARRSTLGKTRITISRRLPANWASSAWRHSSRS